jgi:acyl-CoA hydrolase
MPPTISARAAAILARQAGGRILVAGSAGGRAIIALPSTSRDGTVSRILARLTPCTPVTVARDGAKIVVTEHGVADIGSALPDRRAERLVTVADPRHRDRLANDWNRLRRGMT